MVAQDWELKPMRECEQGKLSLVNEKIVDLFDIKSEDINAWTIAWSLSQTNRYNGQTPVPWDVLSHTAMCYSLYLSDHKEPNPTTALAILLHDASEAFLGDIIHPLKMLPAMAWYSELEDSITQTIFERFGLDWQTIDWKTIKEYDYLSVKHELHWLKPTTNEHEFFRFTETPVARFRKLGKAQPWEYIPILKEAAEHFGAKDIEALFDIPVILKPYLEHTEKTVEEVSIPAPRDSADVDNMRV